MDISIIYVMQMTLSLFKLQFFNKTYNKNMTSFFEKHFFKFYFFIKNLTYIISNRINLFLKD